MLFFPPWDRKLGPPEGLPGHTLRFLWLETVGAPWLGLALDSRAVFLNLWLRSLWVAYPIYTIHKNQLQSGNGIILWLGGHNLRNCIKGCRIKKVGNLCSGGYSFTKRMHPTPIKLAPPTPLPSQGKAKAQIANPGFPHNSFQSTKTQDEP